MHRHTIHGLIIGTGVLFSTFCAADAPAPPPAAQAGYRLNTFTANFTPSTVDTKVTKSPGYKWYNWDLFGKQSDPQAVQLNSDGSATLLGEPGQLLSAVKVGNSGDYVGTSFGGGAYIEGEIRLEAPTPTPGAKAWPAFWALQMEGNVVPNAAQWPGQPPGFLHSIEADFFEYMHKPEEPPATTYGGSLHDWYGIYNKSCGHGLCQVGTPYGIGLRKAPPDANLRQYHRYGFLWIPATAQSKGSAKFYFDGAQIGPPLQWEMLRDQPPPPTNQPWAFGIIDRQHLFLILSTGGGQPMTIRSVNVWQASTAGNWTR